MSSEGSLQSIWRFPIKSFQGESVETACLTEVGLFADRVLALRCEETGKIASGKHPKLGERILDFEARYEREPVPGEALPAIIVSIDGKERRVDDVSALGQACSEALGSPVEVVAAGEAPEVYETYWPEIEDLPIAGATIDFPLPFAETGSFADLEPLHALTTASLARLSDLATESKIEVSRFRPGLVIETGEAEGFVENDWVGRTATLGEARIEFGAVAPRCIMTTRAQAGLPKDPAVLKTLVAENRHEFMGLQMPCLGIYAKVTEPGTIRVGDSLEIG